MKNPQCSITSLERPWIRQSARSERSDSSRRVEHFAKPVDLGSKVARMVADEEPAIVRDVGIDDRPGGVVVEVFDRFMTEKAPARNHPESNTGRAQRSHNPAPVKIDRRVQDQRETEPRAAPVLLLNDEAIIAAEQIDEQTGIAAPDFHHAVEFFQLFAADRS